MKDTQIFLQTENFFARFDDFPVNPGHCEIIPKQHVTSFFDLESAAVIELFELVSRAKCLVDEHFHPAAYNVGINDGAEAGRTVPHLHVHLIPRFAGDVEHPKGGVRNIIPSKADYTHLLKTDPTKKNYIED